MSRRAWKMIEVDYRGKKKKYQLNDKGALKIPRCKNKMKNKQIISANSMLNPPPHPFSVAIISNSSNSKENEKLCQEKSKEKADTSNKNIENQDSSIKNFILDFLKFDDSVIKSEYDYSDETDFDFSELFYD